MQDAALQQQLDREAEARRRIAEVWSNREFMQGVYRALRSVEEGERPTRWNDLKRKNGRSRG